MHARGRRSAGTPKKLKELFGLEYKPATPKSNSKKGSKKKSSSKGSKKGSIKSSPSRVVKAGNSMQDEAIAPKATTVTQSKTMKRVWSGSKGQKRKFNESGDYVPVKSSSKKPKAKSKEERQDPLYTRGTDPDRKKGNGRIITLLTDSTKDIVTAIELNPNAIKFTGTNSDAYDRFSQIFEQRIQAIKTNKKIHQVVETSATGTPTIVLTAEGEVLHLQHRAWAFRAYDSRPAPAQHAVVKSLPHNNPLFSSPEYQKVGEPSYNIREQQITLSKELFAIVHKEKKDSPYRSQNAKMGNIGATAYAQAAAETTLSGAKMIWAHDIANCGLGNASQDKDNLGSATEPYNALGYMFECQYRKVAARFPAGFILGTRSTFVPRTYLLIEGRFEIKTKHFTITVVYNAQEFNTPHISLLNYMDSIFEAMFQTLDETLTGPERLLAAYGDLEEKVIADNSMRTASTVELFIPADEAKEPDTTKRLAEIVLPKNSDYPITFRDAIDRALPPAELKTAPSAMTLDMDLSQVSATDLFSMSLKQATAERSNSGIDSPRLSLEMPSSQDSDSATDSLAMPGDDSYSSQDSTAESLLSSQDAEVNIADEPSPQAELTLAVEKQLSLDAATPRLSSCASGGMPGSPSLSPSTPSMLSKSGHPGLDVPLVPQALQFFGRPGLGLVPPPIKIPERTKVQENELQPLRLVTVGR